MSGNANKNRADEGWICLGKFGSARGLKGEIRFQAFSGDGNAMQGRAGLCRGQEKTPVEFERVQSVARGLVVKLKDVNDRSAAEAINGEELYARREDFPETAEEEYYFDDLVGLMVKNAAGQEIGRVTGMHNFGAGDIVEIDLKEPIKGIGKSAMVPFQQEIIPAVDVEAGFITAALEDWFANQVEAEGDDKQ